MEKEDVLEPAKEEHVMRAKEKRDRRIMVIINLKCRMDGSRNSIKNVIEIFKARRHSELHLQGRRGSFDRALLIPDGGF